MVLAEQMAAAIADTRRGVASALGIPDEPAPRGSSPFFEELWARHGDAPRCPHLRARPVQPSHLVAAEGTWRCRPCSAAWSRRERAQREAGRPWLNPIEDFTCDRCRRYISSGALGPVVVRQDMWVIVCGCCARCAVDIEAQGGRMVP